mmetsp:Transcript_29209/g.33440  ORF Transcript_29209/g.33440 Transcript_29209/m.33440 type:complete len:247 (+) Transcript_29209:271-1011(+)
MTVDKNYTPLARINDGRLSSRPFYNSELFAYQRQAHGSKAIPNRKARLPSDNSSSKQSLHKKQPSPFKLTSGRYKKHVGGDSTGRFSDARNSASQYSISEHQVQSQNHTFECSKSQIEPFSALDKLRPVQTYDSSLLTQDQSVTGSKTSLWKETDSETNRGNLSVSTNYRKERTFNTPQKTNGFHSNQRNKAYKTSTMSSLMQRGSVTFEIESAAFVNENEDIQEEIEVNLEDVVTEEGLVYQIYE